jgi:hypothetical protein
MDLCTHSRDQRKETSRREDIPTVADGVGITVVDEAEVTDVDGAGVAARGRRRRLISGAPPRSSLSVSPPFPSLTPPFPSLARMRSLGGRYTRAAPPFPPARSASFSHARAMRCSFPRADAFSPRAASASADLTPRRRLLPQGSAVREQATASMTP